MPKSKIFADTASEAMLDYSNYTNMYEAIRAFVSDLNGKIICLLYVPLTGGCSEVIDIEFKDSSSIRFTKFINERGSEIGLKKLT